MGFYLMNPGKDRLIMGNPFLWTFKLQSFNPQTNWKTGRLLKGEVEIETMGFECAQRSATKVQQQAQRNCGNSAKGLALFGQGSQEGKEFPRSI